MAKQTALSVIGPSGAFSGLRFSWGYDFLRGWAEKYEMPE